MTDIALNFSDIPGKVGFIDISLTKSDLTTGDELKTAIILSLFTNRRAESDDDLPIGQSDRQGCWIDQFSEKEGDKFGSRLWLLAQSKQTQETLNKGNEYAQEALQWLIDDGIASEVIVNVSFPRMYVIGIEADIIHGDGTSSRFEFLWDELQQDSTENIAILKKSKPFLVLETGKYLVTETGLRIAVG